MSWIAVGLCADVPAGTVVPRVVDGTDLAIWCSATGDYHAWGDRCPHRGMRLSHGFVRGDTLACIYHGWQYDQAGVCVAIPAHPDLTPPKTICAISYACKPQGGLIWAALEAPQSDPPGLEGRRALRTIDVALSAPELTQKLGEPLQPIIRLGGAEDLACALQPCSDTHCLMHVLIKDGQDPWVVSRAAEDMRATLEAA